MMEGWLGQVGFDNQTVAFGEAILTSSKAWRTAPVPPGVATADKRSADTTPSKISSDIAVKNAGSPARPT